MLLSGSLDFLLCLTCLAIAVAAARARNDLLFAGFLWVAAAAFVGALNLGGLTWTNDTHKWLSQVATGPGMLILGLGIVAAIFGPFAAGRWLAAPLGISGVGLIFYLWHAKSTHLGAVTTTMSVVALVALLVLAVVAFLGARPGPGLAALGAVGLLLFAGFGVNELPLGTDSRLQHVDILHLVLTACYLLIWMAVRGVTSPESPR